MWLSNARNNFAPFAGFMLREYEKSRSLASAGQEMDETVQYERGGDEPTKRSTRSRRKRVG